MGTRAQNEKNLAYGTNCQAAADGTDWMFQVADIDRNETTLRFWQEVYDEGGKLVEIHEKFPVDKGHQKV